MYTINNCNINNKQLNARKKIYYKFNNYNKVQM